VRLRWASPHAVAARVLPNDLAALAVSGVGGLAVVGLLVFRMRAALHPAAAGSQ